MILSPDTPESEDLANQNFLDLYQSAMDLYGLIQEKFVKKYVEKNYQNKLHQHQQISFLEYKLLYIRANNFHSRYT